MQPVEQDLKFIESTCQDLNDYVLSDQMYWPVNAQPNSAGGISASRTTIGLLYLVLEQVRHKPLGQNQIETLEFAQTTIDKVRRKWKVAWEKKVAGEFKSRLRLWQNYLTEAHEDPQILQHNYRNDVRNRTILQLLLLDLPIEDANMVLTLYEADEWVKDTLPKGSFVWGAEVQAAFPEEKFWFLYRKIEG